MTSRGSAPRLLLREAITDQRWVLIGAVALLAGWQATEALVPVLQHAAGPGGGCTAAVWSVARHVA